MVKIGGEEGKTEMLKLKEGVVAKHIDDEGIIVDTNTGRYLALNRTAMEMISVMIESDDYEGVINRLMNLIDIDRRTLDGDLKALISRLRELGLVSEASST